MSADAEWVDLDRVLAGWGRRLGPADRYAFFNDPQYHADIENMRILLTAVDASMRAHGLPRELREAIARGALERTGNVGEAFERMERQREMAERLGREPARLLLTPDEYQAMVDRHPKPLMESTVGNDEICTDPNRDH